MHVVALVRGLAGGIAGAAAGFAVCWWILSYGIYAPVLPGAGLGFGFATASGDSGRAYGFVCGVMAIVAGLVTEWKCFPFIADPGFIYMLTHIHGVNPIHLLLLAIGVFAAYNFGHGKTRRRVRQSTEVGQVR